MTFTALRPRVMRRNLPVCAGLQKRVSHGRQTVQMEISFSQHLVSQLGWKLGDKIEIAVGDSTDKGYVRMRPNDSGYILKTSGNTSTRPRLALAYWGNETSFASEPCEFKIDQASRTLTIELPWQKRIVRIA